MTNRTHRPALRRTWILLAALACWSAAATLRADGPREDRTSDHQRNNSRLLAAFRKVVGRASHGTVRVKCDGQTVALGTVVGADGWILTKASELGDGPVVCRFRDGRELKARVVKTHDRYDLALLKVNATGLKAVAFEESRTAPVGNWVASPGLGSNPVAVGVVSVSARTPTNQELQEAQARRGGFLGVGLEPADEGAKIGHVMPRTAASRAGLKVNDVIVAVGETAVSDDAALISLLRTYKPGDLIRIKVKRGEKDLILRIKLGKRPEAERADFQNRLGSDLSRRRLGFPMILQHDTVLKPADCGGPLVDLDGRVIGINIARAGRTESYAIPGEAVLSLVKELSSGKVAPQTARR